MLFGEIFSLKQEKFAIKKAIGYKSRKNVQEKIKRLARKHTFTEYHCQAHII